MYVKAIFSHLKNTSFHIFIWLAWGMDLFFFFRVHNYLLTSGILQCWLINNYHMPPD